MPADALPTFATLDALTRKHTAFKSFEELRRAQEEHGYVPSLRLDLIGSTEGLILADAYNHHTSRPALVWAKVRGQFVSLLPEEVSRRATKARNRPAWSRPCAAAPRAGATT